MIWPRKKPEDGPDYGGDERRKFIRIARNFILHYSLAEKPEEHFEVTQLKNISLGGMCFVSSRPHPHGQKIHIHLKTPYLAETTKMTGAVLETHEKVKDVIYLTRVEFESISPDAELVINKLLEMFIKGDLKSYD